MLSEIGKCVSYGRKFGRAVIVEANSENAAHFKDVFGRYFTSQDANLVLDAKPFVQSFDSMEVLPATVKNQVQHYPLTVAENLLNGNALSFDFLKDYQQQLLVHHSSGQKKGRNAIFATEAAYHALVAGCWICEMKGKRLGGTLCCAALPRRIPGPDWNCC